VRAASLFGKVIDVGSGDAITVFNLNRPVRVKLLGVDAPELDQTFGDVAKKHLADLIYDKSVLVEYSGIAADGSVAGRVLLNNTDIGAQMIRDGAAWFDPNNLSRLSATDREIYQQCEQAARSERRGLWQAENPTAPWEFVKAQSLRKNPYASRDSILSWSKKSGDRPVPELTNLMLLAKTANATGPRLLSRRDVETALDSLTPTHKQWKEMKPAGPQLFSNRAWRRTADNGSGGNRR
jgi:endonuclease YncB( thermonuclease family)